MPSPRETPDNDAAAQSRWIAGRYRLTEPLGSGAMGTVWAGHDEVLRRAVAVKELRVPPGVPAGEMVDMRERMMREARAIGGLSHPNVITLYDVVDVSGDPYVVLELLPCRNLSEVIEQRGRLSVGQAASVGLAVAGALQAAHRAGITHRDVKPANVLVAHDGRIKLTDFGIARKSDDITMTATGLVLGSPAYIAPEVAAGEPVTPAADLWGLGATLFAAVEGQPPYDVDGDPVKTVTAVVRAEVPRCTVTGPLAEVISGLMVKEPAQRLPLGQVRQRLRPLLADPDDPLFPGSPEAFTLPPTRAVPREPARELAAAAQSAVAQPTDPPAAPVASAASATPVASAAPAVSAARGSSDDANGAARATPNEPSPAVGGGGPGSANDHGASAPLATDPGPVPGAPDWISALPPARPPEGYWSNARTGGPPPSPAPGPPSRPAVGQAFQPPPDGRRSGGGRALPLMLAGALAVVVGAASGWAGTRELAGQSPWTTSVASPAAEHSIPAMKNHVDTASLYGPSALGFTALVPIGWEEYRLAGEGETVSVLFVSPDGARELRFDKIRGTRTKPAQPAEFIDTLNAAKLGVAAVAIENRSANEVRYRIDRAGAQGTSSRVGYAQLTSVGSDLWVVQLTVPADHKGEANQRLLDAVLRGFRP